MHNLLFNINANSAGIDILKSLFSKTSLYVLLALVVAWLCYLLISAIYRKDNKKTISIYKIYVGLISTVTAIYILVISILETKAYLNRNTQTFKFEQIFMVLAFLAVTGISLLLYAAIVVIRRYNKKYVDRRTFRWVPLAFVGAGLVLSVAIAIYMIIATQIPKKGIGISMGNVLTLNEHNSMLFAYLIGMTSVIGFTILGLKEKNKVIIYKYIGNSLLVLLFSLALGLLKTNPDITVLESTAVITPFIGLAIFSYKHGFKKSLLVCMLAGVAVGISDISIVSPGHYLIKYILPYTAASAIGSIIGKKNLVLGVALSTLYVGVLSLLSTFLSQLIYVKSAYYTAENVLATNALNLAWPIALFTIISYLIVTFMLITTSATRKHLREERKFCLSVDEDFVLQQVNIKNWMNLEHAERERLKREQKAE